VRTGGERDLKRTVAEYFGSVKKTEKRFDLLMRTGCHRRNGRHGKSGRQGGRKGCARVAETVVQGMKAGKDGGGMVVCAIEKKRVPELQGKEKEKEKKIKGV